MPDDPIDTRLVMLRRAGGDRLIRDLIDLLLEGVPHKLAAARAALLAGDADGAGRVGHSLASSAGNLGAIDLQQAAYDLEHAAAAGSPDLADRLDRLEACWESTRGLLAQKRQGLDL